MASLVRGVAWLLVALALVPTSTAFATGPVNHVELDWERNDPTCISAPDLSRIVEHALARPVFHSDAPALAKIVGSIGKAGPGRFEAHLELRRMDGTTVVDRPLLATSSACRRLDEVVAVAVAVMIDDLEKAPDTVRLPDDPPHPPLPAALPLALPPLPPSREPPRPRDPPTGRPPEVFRLPPLRLRLGLGVGLASSFLPGVVPSVALRGEIALGGFLPIALTMRGHAPSSAVDAIGVGGTFAAWTGEIAGCPGWSIARVRIGGCVGVGGGAVFLIHAIHGASTTNEGTAAPILLASLLPSVALRLVGPLWVRAEVGAWLPLLRQAWVVGVENGNVPGQREVVYRPSPIVPIAGLTFEVKIGS